MTLIIKICVHHQDIGGKVSVLPFSTNNQGLISFKMILSTSIIYNDSLNPGILRNTYGYLD